MKRRTFMQLLAAAFCLGKTGLSSAQMGHGMMGGGMGHGMGGMGGGMGHGMMGGSVDIPGELPRPQTAWSDRLVSVLDLEKRSLVQYRLDSAEYGLRMPYMMVIGDETRHVDWIGRLFSAYGTPQSDSLPQLAPSRSANAAYEVAMGMEAELVPQYEWLIDNASDASSSDVLQVILAQTRHHYMMFSHMGGMGHGMP